MTDEKSGALLRSREQLVRIPSDRVSSEKICILLNQKILVYLLNS